VVRDLQSRHGALPRTLRHLARFGRVRRGPLLGRRVESAEWQRVYLTIRTPLNPQSLSQRLVAQVASVDNNLALTGIRTMDEQVERALAQRKETMYLIAGFAGLALLLAIIGLYGVISYSVTQRTAEIGIRQAIGAQRSDILRMVMGQGLRLSVGGIVVGALGAALLTRMIARLLFQVSATDPLTFLSIAAIFLVVGLGASLLPAWRATRIDPLEALRTR